MCSFSIPSFYNLSGHQMAEVLMEVRMFPDYICFRLRYIDLSSSLN